MSARWIILFVIIAIIEIYAFQAVKTFTKVRWVQLLYLLISVAAIAFIFFGPDLSGLIFY